MGNLSQIAKPIFAFTLKIFAFTLTIIRSIIEFLFVLLSCSKSLSVCSWLLNVASKCCDSMKRGVNGLGQRRNKGAGVGIELLKFTGFSVKC